MTRSCAAMTFIFAVFWWASIEAVSGQESKEVQLAEQAAIRFVEARNAKDVDGMMKAADVPFCGGDKVIKDQAELKKLLTGAIEKSPKDEKLSSEVKAVLMWGQIRGAIDAGDVVSRIDSVLRRSDFLVCVGEGHGFYVRLRDGKAMVVGGW